MALMLDPLFIRVFKGPLTAAGDRLAARGVEAHTVTVVGAAFGLLAAGAIASQWYQIGLALFVLNRMCDGLDGAVARAAGPTDFGGFIDLVADFVVYAALAGAFALADPRFVPIAVLLMISFAGTGTAFLAYAAIAAKRGLDPTANHGPKSLFYVGGLTEGAETIAFFAVACLWPAWFPVTGAIFAAACWVTVAQRIALARRMFP
jgi:phosphatidylglycerophosphate synthase